MKTIFKLFIFLLASSGFAQTSISGTVTDAQSMPLPGANVIVVGTSSGAVTDIDGNFSFSVDLQAPFQVQVSSVGFQSQTIEVTSSNQTLNVSLQEGSLLDEVVISASRVAQRIFESPVTVEKYSLKQIERTPSADFFEGMQNIKGVQMNQSGLVFSQVNTRGFGTVYNEGFVTLIDGMNSQAPVFGFAVGNLIGINELDVQSVELLPGAASALYGMDAYKGIMSIASKNPFDHEGINIYYRSGVTQQVAGGDNTFEDFGIRFAKKLSDKWAVKATVSVKQGTEWTAADTRHQRACDNCGEGSIVENYDVNAPDYNAVNEYGEIAVSSNLIFGQLASLTGNAGLLQLAALSPNYFDTVLTTGYMENDIFGTEAENIKGNAGIYFRPNDKTEISLSSVVGTGEAPLPAGNARYNLKDVVVQLHKLELNSGGLNARVYYTHEDSGTTTQSSALATAMANAQPGGILQGWGGTYLNTYLGTAAFASGFTPDLAGVAQLLGAVSTQIGTALATGGPAAAANTSFNDLFGGSTQFAHIPARAAADANMLMPGTSAFNQALESASNTAINQLGAGAQIQDISAAYTFEANYDFEDKIDFANLIVGGLYRSFNLDTGGTLYTDYDAPIEYSEFGVYAQAEKNLFNDFVTLTASMRYDKVEVMENANISPRLGLLFNLSDKENIRFSIQKGFRNPTNQDKFIGLFNGARTLLGTTEQNIDRFSQPSQLQNTQVVNLTGADVWNNAFYADSLEDADLSYVEAEEVTSLELGYRYNTSGFSLDINAYYSDYSNYIGTDYVLVPFYTDAITNKADALAAGSVHEFGVDANLDVPFSTYGVSLEAIKSISPKTNVNLIYEYNNLDYSAEAGSTFELSWNTPKHRVKMGFNSQLADNLSFGANARYNSTYYYESSFIDAMIDSNTVVDAKLTYDFPGIQSGLKLEVGGNNIGGDEYVSIPGSGNIGSLYYAGLKVGF